MSERPTTGDPTSRPNDTPDRRRWLAAAAALGAALLTKLGWPERAAALGTPLDLGMLNGATANTGLVATLPGDSTLTLINNAGSGTALRAQSDFTSGVPFPA